MILDCDYKVKFINKKGCKLLSMDKQQILGLNWVENFLPEREKQTAYELLQNIFLGKQDELEYFQNVVLGERGLTERAFIWHSSVLPEEGDQRTSVLFSGEDITEMKEIDRMKSELMNIVSHEIRTPLASIRGFSELMLNRSLPLEKTQCYLQTIHKEAERLSKFIDDFLDIQRIENSSGNIEQLLELEVFDLNVILNEVALLFQSNRTHQLIITSSEKGVRVNADFDKIRRLITNLVSNAFKYSHKGLPVNLVCEATEGYVRVTVEDKGPGVPEESIPQLFSKYYRVQSLLHRKVTGTGLGLAICKSIVEAHKGRIWVESKVSEGSRFIFELPRVVGV